MKKFIKVALLSFFINSSSMFAQLVDVPSAAGATALATEYLLLYNSSLLLSRSMKSFKKQYGKRVQYYAGSYVFKEQINYKLDFTQERIDALTEENELSASSRYYSKSKKNIKLLADIQFEFDILDSELGNQDWDTTIFGEKINLYQNMMKTVTRLHRLLDIVEGNVADSAKREEVLAAIMDNIIPVPTDDIETVVGLINDPPGLGTPEAIVEVIEIVDDFDGEELIDNLEDIELPGAPVIPTIDDSGVVVVEEEADERIAEEEARIAEEERLAKEAEEAKDD